MQVPGQGREEFVPAHVAEVVTGCQEYRLLILRNQPVVPRRDRSALERM